MSEANRLRDLVASYFKIDKDRAEAFADAVLEAYPDEAKKAGPYVHGTRAGDDMARRISAQTGLSFGTVKGVLHNLFTLAQRGQISPATYNPGKFGLVAKVSAAVQTAAGGTKRAVSAALPDPVKKALEGVGEGVGGLGDVARLLPLAALVAAGLFVYSKTRRGAF